jgi:hypothetical protein
MTPAKLPPVKDDLSIRGHWETSMTEHKIGLMMGENKAFIERIAWYTVGVVNLLADINHQEKTMADGLGTGTACTWKGHSLILTAEHVVAGAEPDSLAFLLRVDDAINWEGMGKPEEVVSRVFLPVEKIVRCKKRDLAAIVLRTKDLTGFGLQFCELPKQLAESRTPKSEGSLIILGYPTDRRFCRLRDQDSEYHRELLRAQTHHTYGNNCRCSNEGVVIPVRPGARCVGQLRAQRSENEASWV